LFNTEGAHPTMLLKVTNPELLKILQTHKREAHNPELTTISNSNSAGQ